MTTPIDTKFTNDANGQLAVPAQLFAGDRNAIVAHTQKYIQRIFCQQNVCNTCVICLQIINRQYHNMFWLDSDKNYTREQLQPIFDSIVFARSTDNPFFFIVQNADYLTSACANSLLKSLEEPPTGYHFILLTDRADQILTTIRSRCIITHIQGATSIQTPSQLFEVFTSTQELNPVTFLKLLDKTKISEHESIQLLDQLLDYWINRYKVAVEQQNVPEQKATQDMTIILKAAIEKPPMPGSSKLLWKNLFLQKYKLSL